MCSVDVLVVPEQAQLLLTNLDGASAELRNQHLVTRLYAGSDALSILVKGAGADGEDLGFVELLDGRLGEEDAGCGLGFGLDALDEDAVEEGRNAADGLDCGLWGNWLAYSCVGSCSLWWGGCGAARCSMLA
jgi:hypothetical protein